MKDSESSSRRQAVALAYQDGEAPRVLARGYGDLAERIIAEARRQDVFVHDAPELVGVADAAGSGPADTGSAVSGDR
jgi:flagellar biosynthesis protein